MPIFFDAKHFKIGQLKESEIVKFIEAGLEEVDYAYAYVEKIEVVSFTPDSFEIKIFENMENNNFLEISLKDKTLSFNGDASLILGELDVYYELDDIGEIFYEKCVKNKN